MKINIGAGPVRYDGWTNVDFSKKEKPDIVADVTKLPFDDNSIEAIHASHILEHIAWDIDIFKEWSRILAPGGEISIAVPDIPQMIALFEAGLVDKGYFQATIYGAKILGLDEKSHDHHRSYTPSMLMNEMSRYFTNIRLGFAGSMSPRKGEIGEVAGVGYKPT